MRISKRFWSKFYIFSKYQRQYIFHSKTGGGGGLLWNMWDDIEQGANLNVKIHIWPPSHTIFPIWYQNLGRTPINMDPPPNLLDSDKICLTSAQNSMTSYFRYTFTPRGGQISLYIPGISPLSDHGGWRMDNHSGYSCSPHDDTWGEHFEKNTFLGENTLRRTLF